MVPLYKIPHFSIFPSIKNRAADVSQRPFRGAKNTVFLSDQSVREENRMRIVAICARVAVPVGSSLSSSTPFTS